MHVCAADLAHDVGVLVLGPDCVDDPRVRLCLGTTTTRSDQDRRDGDSHCEDAPSDVPRRGGRETRCGAHCESIS